ncbi:MAG: hypothetical protein PHO05_09065, partial [bacterium]|nr:hypothetical protein [bacterium]
FFSSLGHLLIYYVIYHVLSHPCKAGPFIRRCSKRTFIVGNRRHRRTLKLDNPMFHPLLRQKGNG